MVSGDSIAEITYWTSPSRITGARNAKAGRPSGPRKILPITGRFSLDGNTMAIDFDRASRIHAGGFWNQRSIGQYLRIGIGEAYGEPCRQLLLDAPGQLVKIRLRDSVIEIAGLRQHAQHVQLPG